MVSRSFLVLDANRCTGCRICELACSFQHDRNFNPRKSRIEVLKREKIGIFVPTVCLHCGKAPCLEACPSGAIYRDEKLGAVLINYDLCIKCHMCAIACPFGAISIEEKTLDPLKCDLCDGEPQCALRCPTGAIKFLSGDRVGHEKRRDSSDRLIKAMSPPPASGG